MINCNHFQEGKMMANTAASSKPEDVIEILREKTINVQVVAGIKLFGEYENNKPTRKQTLEALDELLKKMRSEHENPLSISDDD